MARLLMRLARKIDRGSTSARKLCPTEEFEALSARYPGAPDHWLELVAARAKTSVSLGSHPTDSAVAREDAQFTVAQQSRPGREAQGLSSTAVARGAPTVRFARDERRTRSIVRFTSPARSGALDSRSSDFPRGGRPDSRRRGAIAFASPRKALRAHVRFSTAPPVQSKRLLPSFSSPAVSVRQAPPRFEVAQPPAHAREESVYPPSRAVPVRSSEWQDAEIADRRRERNSIDFEPRSPETKHRNHLSWMIDGPHPGQREIDFKSLPNPWPELPSPDESDPASSQAFRGNARLAVEQMVGRWSG